MPQAGEIHWSRRIPLVGPVALTRPRWAIAVTLGLIVYFLLFSLPRPIRLIGAWDVACLFFLVATTIMALRESCAQVRQRARSQDQGAAAVLLLTLGGALVCLITIVTGSKEVAAFVGGGKGLPAALVGFTMVLTWMTIQSSFALHYAHLFYGDDAEDPEQHAGGLSFPGDEAPDYLDFAYFSFVLGMTFQVSDVEVTDRGFRRIALLHGIVSFFFSTVILALAINLLAGLLQ